MKTVKDSIKDPKSERNAFEIIYNRNKKQF